VTSRTAPALNASSYRGGAVRFFVFFCSITCAPLLSSLRLFSLSVNSGMGALLMQFDQPASERLVLQPAPAGLLCLPAVVPAAVYRQTPACLFPRGPLTFERLDAAVSLLYGFDRMPTDFFKTCMPSSFSPRCLRRLRFSASTSRLRFCSRLCLLT